MLFNAIDALIGSPEISEAFDGEQPAEIQAYILDSTIHAGNDLSVTAESSATIDATLSNEATAAASALYGATGMATSGLIASNMVSSTARAFIDFTPDPDSGEVTPGDIQVGGDTEVFAKDLASILAVSTMTAISITSNDGGVNIVNGLAGILLNEYHYTTKSGTREVLYGEKVRVDDNYAGGGIPGTLYRYLGEDDTIDLGAQDYSDGSLWEEVTEENVLPVGINVSESDAIAIGAQVVRNDVRSDVLSSINNAIVNTESLSLDALEDANIQATITSWAESDGGSPIAGGTSLAVGVSIATNMVLSQANAHVSNRR